MDLVPYIQSSLRSVRVPRTMMTASWPSRVFSTSARLVTSPTTTLEALWPSGSRWGSRTSTVTLYPGGGGIEGQRERTRLVLSCFHLVQIKCNSTIGQKVLFNSSGFWCGHTKPLGYYYDSLQGPPNLTWFFKYIFTMPCPNWKLTWV